MNDQTPFFGL